MNEREAPEPGYQWREICVDGSTWMTWIQVPVAATPEDPLHWNGHHWEIWTAAHAQRAQERSRRWERETRCPECGRPGHPKRRIA